MKYHYNDHSSIDRRRKLRKDQTDAEIKLWRHLRNKQLDGYKFYRQYSCGPYILDFYSPKIRLAIELDGGQHFESEYDQRRTGYLNSKGIFVMRFWNDQVLLRTNEVVEFIWKYLNNSPHPPLILRGGDKDA